MSSMAAPAGKAPKILAIGSPNSSFKNLVKRIKTFHEKYGPFDCCIIVGNLFKRDDDGSSLTPDIEFPIPTYFHTPSHPLPTLISSRLANNNGSPELIRNLIYLGKCGVMKTSSGVGLGFIGGRHSRERFELEEGEREGEGYEEDLTKKDIQSLLSNPHFTSQTYEPPSNPNPAENSNFIPLNLNAPTPSTSLSAARQYALESRIPAYAKGLDILILNSAPPEVLKGSMSAEGLVDKKTWGEGPEALREVIVKGRPRYILFAEDGEKKAPELKVVEKKQEKKEEDLSALPPWEREQREAEVAAAVAAASAEKNEGEASTSDPVVKKEAAPVKSTPGFYWEREPFGWVSVLGGVEERWTRVVRLERFAEEVEEVKEKGKKEKGKRFYSAFTLPDLNTPTPPTRPDDATANPYVAARGMKRGADGDGGMDGKRGKYENGTNGRSNQVPPPGYLCKKCNVPGHYIRECPKNAPPDASQPPQRKPPPETYVCKVCSIPGHWIEDCPERAAQNAARGPRTREPIKELSPDECWFCLANPKLDQKLIITIRDQVYIALSKGQIVPTEDKEKSLVPGGGHLLIIPITHTPNPMLLPVEEAKPILDEIEATKKSIRTCFERSDAVPVFCELYRNIARAGHGQIQAVPIPSSRAGELEKMFRDAAKKEGFDWDADEENAIATANGREFLRIDLPNGKTLVHFIQGRFNLQFARQHLANFLGLPERANWKNVEPTEAQIKRDAAAFKKEWSQIKA